MSKPATTAETIAHLIETIAQATAALDHAYCIAGPELQARIDADETLAVLSETDIRASAARILATAH